MSQVSLRSKTGGMAKNDTSKDVSNNELAGLIATQGKAMQEQIHRLGNELREEINKGLDGIRGDLAEVNIKLVKVKTNVDDNTDAIARSALCNDLIISNVPFVMNENLLQYFKIWCKVLGYADSTVPMVDLRRLSRSPLREGANCFILVQFAITNQRNDFFVKYLRSRSLTLAQIGFKSENRVFINENLTPSARKLKSKAVELKRQGMLSSVYCRGGMVHVRLPNSDQDHVIKSEEDLLCIGQRN